MASSPSLLDAHAEAEADENLHQPEVLDAHAEADEMHLHQPEQQEPQAKKAKNKTAAPNFLSDKHRKRKRFSSSSSYYKR
jgi:hypothetical protein